MSMIKDHSLHLKGPICNYPGVVAPRAVEIMTGTFTGL